MPLPELPIEIVLHILKCNLDPHDYEAWTNGLNSYCLISKAFKTTFQPMFLEHIRFGGDDARLKLQLRQFKKRLSEGGRKARQRVKTVSCSLGDAFNFTVAGITKEVEALVMLCSGIEELALSYMKDLDLRNLFAGLPHLQVLHLAACEHNLSIEDGQSSSKPDLAFPSLRHLALGHTDVPAACFPNLESFSDSASVGWCPSIMDESPQLSSVRIKFNVTRGLEPWPKSIKSLEIIQNLSLEAVAFPLAQLEHLHTDATLEDLDFLDTFIRSGESNLKTIRISRSENSYWNLDQSNLYSYYMVWEMKKETLAQTCVAKGVAAEFYCQPVAEEGRTAVEFWKGCTDECFVLNGFTSRV